MSKKLYRSRENVILGGVAAGLADYLEVDISLVRLLWAFAAVMGPGVIAYVVAWVVIPQEPTVPEYLEAEEINGTWDTTDSSEETRDPADKQRTLGFILIAVGLVFLVRRFIPGFVFSWTWPVVLIGFGAYILTQDKKKE